MNPKSYCIERSIATADFISKAKEVAPKYSKSTHCMASNPEYGVRLMPFVSNHIRGKADIRTKPCKFTFRLLERDRREFNAAKTVLGHSTDQEAVEYAIQLYISAAKEKTAATAATVDDCKPNKSTDSISA